MTHGSLTFLMRMAVRETRAAWRRLIFFFICVAVGVGSIVALRSVIQSVRAALVGEARTLLAADISLQSNRNWDEALRREIEQHLRGARVLDRTETIETATMARPANERNPVARMVEVRGVQPSFPFYGRVVLDGGGTYTHELLAGRGALVRAEVLTQLNVAVGDAIVVGETPFTIRGIILREPGARVGAFSLGPRVLIDHDDLRATGLLGVGSRARYRMLLRVAEGDVDRLAQSLETAFRDRFVSARSYRSTEDNLGEDFGRAENYLSLVGFVILVLGGIGVWSVTRVFVTQKVKSIAVLKCLGATGGQVLAIYVAQVLVLGLAGSLVGVGLAAAAIKGLPAFSTPVVGSVSYGLTWSASLQGIAVGVLVSLLFALVPLLEIRQVKPLLLLRPQGPGQRAAGGTPDAGAGWRRIASRVVPQDRARVVAIAGVVATLVAVAAWQAGSWRIGLAVCAGFAAVTLAASLAAVALVRLTAPLGRARWFPLRHAVRGLGRPGNQTRVILVSVGLGSFFLIGVYSLQTNLLRQFSAQMGPGSPDMFLIDIQPDQAVALGRFLGEANPEYPARLLPVLRARIVGIEGRDVNLDGYDSVRGRGLGREYVLTYRDHLEVNERLVEGRLWTAAETDAQVSVEEGLRDRFDLALGDIVEFDILGGIVRARITSVRDVEWSDARSGGFMFVLNPVAVAGAPCTLIAALQAPTDVAARGRFQRDLVVRFPNVSAIDVREIVATVQTVVSSVTFAITLVGAVTVLSGTLILVGAIAMTKFQRVYEAAIFKTLGARSRTMMMMMALEYGALGTLAGTIGSAGALVLTWALATWLFEIPWTPAFLVNAGGIALTALGVGGVGVLASLDVLRRKPLGTLRAE